MQPIIITTIDNTDDKIAEDIKAVQYASYLQEARLLGAIWFPPLEKTVADIQRAPDRFFGAYIGNVLVGVASMERFDSQSPAAISSMTVTPKYQRRGVARALLATLLETEIHTVTVSTGARNAPALALYAAFGFEIFKYRTVGEEQLELVELKRDWS